MNAIICIAGGIATGKTTLAQTLIDRWPNSSVRSFGIVVRDIARAQGRPLDRANLQQVGAGLVAHGWTVFCDLLLADVPVNLDVLIIEGIYHAEPVHEVRQRYPSTPVYVVLLHAPPDAIVIRLAQRGETTDVRDQPVESDAEQVASLADLIVDSTRPVAEIADEVNSLLSAHQPSRRRAPGRSPTCKADYATADNLRHGYLAQ